MFADRARSALCPPDFTHARNGLNMGYQPTAVRQAPHHWRAVADGMAITFHRGLAGPLLAVDDESGVTAAPKNWHP